MSRSGYTDDIDDVLEYGRWRGAVNSAINGTRGQSLLKELLIALDEMPEKKLYPNNFQTGSGEFCTLGVLGNKRGIPLNDLGDGGDGCDSNTVGNRFGIAPAMAAEIMFMNDEWNDDCTPDKRWANMRKWVKNRIKDE